jgi:hypothetical protein
LRDEKQLLLSLLFVVVVDDDVIAVVLQLPFVTKVRTLRQMTS